MGPKVAILGGICKISSGPFGCLVTPFALIINASEALLINIPYALLGEGIVVDSPEYQELYELYAYVGSESCAVIILSSLQVQLLTMTKL